MEMDIIALNKELTDCINEKRKLEWALLIESNMYKRIIELEKWTTELQEKINLFYHPIEKWEVRK
jgi:hypothetical protein